MGNWLKTLGLRRCMPNSKEVKNKQNYFKHITDEEFKKAKSKLLQYLKNNNITVVRDHCHFTGEFRGAAHQYCNLMIRKRLKIPAFFHNYNGYDSHLLFKSLSCVLKPVEVLAKFLEKFTSNRPIVGL